MMVNEKPVPASICGQYVKTNCVFGKGSQRVVYKSNDLYTGRSIAWSEPKLKGEKNWKTFTESSLLLETIKHPNIVCYIDFWEASPSNSRTPVLLTELLGCTLKQHLSSSPRMFQPAAIMAWARQILEAVSYLHSRSIVHRTLRCDHVCVNPNTGTCKISSFGSAIFLEPGKRLEDILDPIEYLSPEMAAESYTATTDIYSYGITLLEMVSGGEPPYEECNSSSLIQYREKYPELLDKVEEQSTKHLIRSCIEHDLNLRYNLDQIYNHAYFQTPLPNGSPKISIGQVESEDVVRIMISYSDNQEMQSYPVNITTDQPRYVAAALVRGDYIKASHLQDATIKLHKIIEKYKRYKARQQKQIEDFYNTPMVQPIPAQNKNPKPHKIILKECDFDPSEGNIELELSHSRNGKIIKFKFGVQDSVAEDISDNLVKKGHLTPESKDDFLEKLTAIINEKQGEIEQNRRPPTDGEQDVESEAMEPEPIVDVEDSVSTTNETPSTENYPDLSIEVRRKLSRDNVSSNHVMSPDLDMRSVYSETSGSVAIDNFNSITLPNGLESGSVISPPIVSSQQVSIPPSYYRTGQPGMMPQYMMPQYMMMPPGSMPSQGMPPLPSNYVMMHPAPHGLPGNLYTNGHIPGWGHGAPLVRAQHDLNSMRLPVSSALPYVASTTAPGTSSARLEMEVRTLRNDQDTPPPGFRGDVPVDCRSDT